MNEWYQNLKLSWTAIFFDLPFPLLAQSLGQAVQTEAQIYLLHSEVALVGRQQEQRVHH